MTRSGRSLWMDSASRPAKPTRLGCGPFRTGPKIAPNGVLYHPNFSMDLDFNFWIWVNSPLLTRRLQFRILLGELETISNLPATRVNPLADYRRPSPPKSAGRSRAAKTAAERA